MRKNTVDKNSKEKYERGVNVKCMEINRRIINRRIIRPQRRRDIRGKE